MACASASIITVCLLGWLLGRLTSSWLVVEDLLSLNEQILTGFAAYFVKGAFCDAIAQSVLEKQRYDGMRALVFSVFSGMYGVYQGFLFNGLYSRIFGDASTAWIVVTKTAFEVTVHSPLVYQPFTKMALNACRGQGPQVSLWNYGSDLRRIKVTYAVFWVPIHMVMFAIVPVQLRSLWVASIPTLGMAIVLGRHVAGAKELRRQGLALSMLTLTSGALPELALGPAQEDPETPQAQAQAKGVLNKSATMAQQDILGSASRPANSIMRSEGVSQGPGATIAICAYSPGISTG
eukprot:CAMPEP_0197660998 /NCGR_PEP_ID=MMETSP1338-20131121/51187_1 /TAXON_ID=43686 ORGANISM="Pelagodinium beii, Strain RCC1491" /NCGR_SAMPLE_ID=MMETSP1338 /ASSEMBLY_ACC=CAM_ASM_000754 /LENGTH=291 /DNA_ID=CAMNT_0043238463 /DNA_START=75 /DNA_END=951 /DNA_ORIENTATION=+